MEGKILIINEFTGTNEQTFKNYKFSLKGRKFWLSELDFKQHKHLFEKQEDKLILKASAEQYVVKKKSNKKGEFYVILPNLETTISSVAEPEVAYSIINKPKDPDITETQSLPGVLLEKDYVTQKKKDSSTNLERDKDGRIIFTKGITFSEKSREQFKEAVSATKEDKMLKPKDEDIEENKVSKNSEADSNTKITEDSSDIKLTSENVSDDKSENLTEKPSLRYQYKKIGHHPSKRTALPENIQSKENTESALKEQLASVGKPSDTKVRKDKESFTIPAQEQSSKATTKSGKLVIPVKPENPNPIIRRIKLNPNKIKGIKLARKVGKEAEDSTLPKEKQLSQSVVLEDDEITPASHTERGWEEGATQIPIYKISTQQYLDSDKRVSFIKGLLKISQQQQVNHRTRERLFSLVEKELGKTGGVEMEILRELHEIKSKLFPHDNVDLKAGTIHSEEGLSLEKPIKKSRKGLHKPRDVAEFMQLFEKRSGLKWLTHDFDNSESEFEIEIFLKQAKTIFDEFIGHHYLPTSLWRITHEFAFNENPQWGEKMYIKQGWSSPTWIDWSKSEKIHPMRNNEFYEIIQEFRRQTRIESPKLEILIRNELRIALKDEFSEWQVELIDCQKADFYTNTVFFKKALALIFDGIGKRSSISKKLIVKYIREVEGAYKKKVIKICHQDSFLTRPVEDLINEITNEEKGDFNSVKNYLYGYCDWMIETKYESDPIRITVLGEEKGVDIEFLDIKSKVEGFTHFLTFYTK